MNLPRTSSAGLCILLACLGCNQQLPANAIQGGKNLPAPVAGNWQIASTDPAAARLASLSGELSGSGAKITGIVHANSTSACVPSTTRIALTGSADDTNALSLTGANLAGGTLTITGTLAADGKSIQGARYMVTGGTCAFAAALATAQSFSSITGNYTGTFSDSYGQVLSISAMLTQNPAADGTGDFQLSGTATLGTNPCFSSPATVSSSQVTGGAFTLTYNDPNLANSVTASGSFSADGSTLTVTSWALSGVCGADSGTGVLTR